MGDAKMDIIQATQTPDPTPENKAEEKADRDPKQWKKISQTSGSSGQSYKVVEQPSGSPVHVLNGHAKHAPHHVVFYGGPKPVKNYATVRTTQPPMMSLRHQGKQQQQQRRIHEYHTAPVHNLGIKMSPRDHPRPRSTSPRHTPSAPAGTLRRQATERKEKAISHFDIEMDKVDSYQYRPGEEILGAINIVVRKNIEIRFVELLVTGKGSATIHKNKYGMPKSFSETYIHVHTFVIGTGDMTWSSVLTPGHYHSKFRVKLPPSLPSTIHHDDLTSGFSMDISYSLKARICDDVSTGSLHSVSSTSHLVKVLLSKKLSFNVQRAFDLNTVPDASMPITHTEQVSLSCAQGSVAVVSVFLDRAVFLAGDDIRLQLSSTIPSSHRIKTIECSLLQHIQFDTSNTVTCTLSRMIRKDPQQLRRHRDQHSRRQTQPLAEGLSKNMEETSFDVTIPTQTNLLSSFMMGKSLIKLSYSLHVVLRLGPAGGKLSFKVPLAIGPCAEPIYAEKISSRKAVPLFNRPTRFPCFSPVRETPPPSFPKQATGSASVNVMTKYSNSLLGKCFLCCTAAVDSD